MEQQRHHLQRVIHVKEELTYALDSLPSLLDQITKNAERLEEGLTRKNERLVQQKDELVQQRDELVQQRDELVQQRDELVQQRDELVQQRDELVQQRDELVQKKDELVQKKDELVQQRDELVQQRDELVQQRDELVQKKDEVTRQKDELVQKNNELVSSPEVERNENLRRNTPVRISIDSIEITSTEQEMMDENTAVGDSNQIMDEGDGNNEDVMNIENNVESGVNRMDFDDLEAEGDQTNGENGNNPSITNTETVAENGDLNDESFLTALHTFVNKIVADRKFAYRLLDQSLCKKEDSDSSNLEFTMASELGIASALMIVAIGEVSDRNLIATEIDRLVKLVRQDVFHRNYLRKRKRMITPSSHEELDEFKRLFTVLRQ